MEEPVRGLPPARALPHQGAGTVPVTYVCGKCGHEEPTYRKAERHSDAHGGGRITIRATDE